MLSIIWINRKIKASMCVIRWKKNTFSGGGLQNRTRNFKLLGSLSRVYSEYWFRYSNSFDTRIFTIWTQLYPYVYFSKAYVWTILWMAFAKNSQVGHQGHVLRTFMAFRDNWNECHTLKPRYNEPRYSEFHDIVKKTQLPFCGFTKHIIFDIVNYSI